jgi:glycerophosphoryl diester phosphodiesterase
MTRNPSWLTEVPVAHRGLHNIDAGLPENSLAAFDAAALAAYPVEFDVRLARDGTVMVFHDATLDRLTGRTGRVIDLDAAELQSLRLAGSDQCIPTFAQVLALLDGRVPAIVEIKSFEGAVGPCEEATLKVLESYHGEYTIQSFNPYCLDWVRRHAPEIIRGQLSGNFERYDSHQPLGQRKMLRRLMFDYLSQPDYISYDVNDLPYLPVEQERARGRPNIAFTVKSQAQYERIAPYVDNIIFEGFRPGGATG